jgi:hypothetical protein
LLKAKINFDFLYTFSLSSHFSTFSNQAGIQLFGKFTHSQVSLFFAGVITCKHIKSFQDEVFVGVEFQGLSITFAHTLNTKLLFAAAS